MSRNPLYPSTMRNRVEFLRRAVTVNHGIPTERWETAFFCWCAVEPLSGREFWEAAAVNRETELRFTIRYRRDVLPEMRIRLEGTVYDITSIVDANNRHVMLEIMARSVTPDGKCPD